MENKIDTEDKQKGQKLGLEKSFLSSWHSFEIQDTMVIEFYSCILCRDIGPELKKGDYIDYFEIDFQQSRIHIAKECVGIEKQYDFDIKLELEALSDE